MLPTRQFPLRRLFVCMRQASLAALVCTPVYSLTAMASTEPSLSDQPANDRTLDWVPLGELTEEQKKTVPVICCGAYVPPLRTDTDAQRDPNEAPFRAYADETSNEGQDKVLLNGEVSITQGNRSISTENVVMDKATGLIDMKGGIQLRDPAMMVRADSAQMNKVSGETKLENTRFVLYESRIHGIARQLHKFGDNIINLYQSEMSSCEPGDNSWSIKGSEISLHPDEHYGTAQNMRVNIKDVPVIYMPYVRFPMGNERLTGFLFPSFSHNSRNGWDTIVPFYWNIAPQMDATITPRYMSERGAMLDVDFRHLAEHFESELNSSFIKNDRGGLNPEDPEEKTVDPNRWYARFEQHGGLGEAWSTTIDYADMSDRFYLRDMYSGSIDSNRQAFVRQMASADYRTEHWFMGVQLDEYRLLTKNQLPYRDLPRTHLDGNYQFGDWTLRLDNKYVNFAQNRYWAESFKDYEHAEDGQQKLINALQSTVFGQRINTDYNLQWNKNYIWGYFKPSVGVRTLSYQFKDWNLAADDDASPSFAVPQGNLDAGLYFERDSNLFGGSYIQTLEPRLFYLYRDYKDQSALYGLTQSGTNINFDTNELTFSYDQLFRTTRFAGGDRIDDANQVTLAVSTAYISQDTGTERLRVSLGQIFYAADRKITVVDDEDTAGENVRGTSDLALQVTGQVSQRLRVLTDLAYDRHSSQLDNASFSLHYLDDKYRIFNLSYRYTLKPLASNPSLPDANLYQSLDEIDQVDASLLLPINSRWSVIARSNHDFTHGVELDTFAGLEYNDCCYRVRLLGRRWLRIDYGTPDFLANVTNDDYEPGVMFELELKGFGSMDQRISKLLDKAMPGFEERDKHLR
jgi:LPS-assembly protein